MNIEPDIFDYLETTSLEPHDDYTSEISYKDQKIIWNRLKTQQNEIDRLNNIINELEKCIKEKYNEAHNYQTKIRQSDLQQGDYPVSYYYAERDEKMSIYYLDKLKELKGSVK